MVTSTADSGPGSFREALELAQPYDRIVFDPQVFPPGAPAVIMVETTLPVVSQGHITIDASNAGVIIDGSSNASGDWEPGIDIHSANNRVMGITVQNFTGTGIVVTTPNGIGNVIGGDPGVGRGPTGQGNRSVGNDMGFGVWDRATGNMLTGNIAEANRSHGVWVSEGAYDNTIGPHNRLANNHDCGVLVNDSHTVGITVTANEIVAAHWTGICLEDANNDMTFPVVAELAGGRMTGWSCPGCRVEVFAVGPSSEIEFLAATESESDGRFSVESSTFTEVPFLTTTATDRAGSTSRYSPPFSTVSGPSRIQIGNVARLEPFIVVPTWELPPNRVMGGLGFTYEFGGDPRALQHGVYFGGQTLEVSFSEGEPPIDWTIDEFELTRNHIEALEGLGGLGVGRVVHLHFWDKEGYRNGERLDTPRFRTQSQIDDFIEYVRFVTRTLKGRVDYYGLWSEPDYCGDGGIKCITPEDYIRMARQVIPVIREEDPGAKITVAPNVIAVDLEFLLTVLRSDVAPLFDVVQWHGLYHVTPDNPFYAERNNYYYDYRRIVREIKATAEANGFSGEYWSTEISFGAIDRRYDVVPQAEFWQVKETDKQAAKYWLRWIVDHLGIEVMPGLAELWAPAPWSYQSMRRLNTVMAGASVIDLDTKVDGLSPGTLLVSHTFSYSDGAVLLALWDDGVASDGDPTVPVRVTLPLTRVSRVVGIDVLFGFEQELDFEVTADGVVIGDLLLKDYPLIIRVEGSG